MFLHGTGRRRDARVAVEIPVEVDRALVEDGSHHLVGLPQTGDRAGSSPLDAVLLEHRDVADAEHDLGAPPTEFVERGGELGNVGRLPHVDRRDAGAEPDALRALGGGGEQEPGVLVVDLVGAVTGVVAEPVGHRDRIQELGRGLLGKQLEAEEHEAASLTRPARGKGAAASPLLATMRARR